MKRTSLKRPNARTRQLLTRPPLDRMQQIFQAIKDGRYPNRLTLSSDIEVTTKTIQRDLDFMRDRLNLPIAYNEKLQGYEFTQPVESFPMIELCEAELVSVYVAQKALMQYKGTPFEHSLRSAFEKIVSGMEGKLTVSWDDLESFVSFRGFELVPADLSTFQAVSEAVRGCVRLTFEYRKLNASKYEKRAIEPYHLACIHNQWYCFGRDLKRHQIRTFVLTRMRAATTTAETFQKTGSFSLSEHLKDSLGVFSGKQKHRICIRFDAFAAQLVRERIWHAGQVIQELTEGGIELRLTLSSLEEIEPWVLSWGEHAQVLEPAELIERIKANARAQLAFYRD